MKTYLFYLPLLMPALFFSCKKDYPNDIPIWLEKKIREYKKSEGQEKCYEKHSYCMSIYEVSCTNELFYYFDYAIGTGPVYYYGDFYDNNGNFICSESAKLGYSSSCDTTMQIMIHPPTCVKMRVIWMDGEN